MYIVTCSKDDEIIINSVLKTSWSAKEKFDELKNYIRKKFKGSSRVKAVAFEERSSSKRGQRAWGLKTSEHEYEIFFQKFNPSILHVSTGSAREFVESMLNESTGEGFLLPMVGGSEKQGKISVYEGNVFEGFLLPMVGGSKQQGEFSIYEGNFFDLVDALSNHTMAGHRHETPTNNEECGEEYFEMETHCECGTTLNAPSHNTTNNEE